MTTEYYRFEDNGTEDGRVCFVLQTYRVLKVTPCGVWVGAGSRKRFVLNQARKRFAYPTQAEAWESLLARRKREQAILKWRTNYVAAVLDRMAEGVPPDVPVYPMGHWEMK